MSTTTCYTVGYISPRYPKIWKETRGLTGRRRRSLGALRNDSTRQAIEFLRLHILLAHELEAFLVGRKPHIEAALPRSRVRARILNRHFVLDGVEIGSREPFDQVQLLGVGCALPIDPEPLVEPDGVEHDGVAFPVADGVSQIGRLQILRVRPAVVINDPVRVRAAGVRDDEALLLRKIEELGAVRR